MPDPEKVKLLFGPYQPPPLKRGDVAFCYIRDYPVIVTGWSDAPIPWPRCLPLDPPRQGRGLLIEDELARAILHESALAVAHWWGVSVSTVWHWRKALGVTRKNNQGTYRLVLGAIGATLESRFGEGGPQRRRGRPCAPASRGLWPDCYSDGPTRICCDTQGRRVADMSAPRVEEDVVPRAEPGPPSSSLRRCRRSCGATKNLVSGV